MDALPLVVPLLPPEAGAVPVVATEATAEPNSVVEAGVFVVAAPVVVVVVAMVVRVALEGRDALPVKARKVRGKGSPPGHTSP